MTQNDNNDLDDVMRRLNQEFGEKREQPPPPVYGEARPLPPPPAQPQPQPQRVGLALPMEQPRAYMVLLVLNVAIFAIPFLLDLVGVRVGGLPVSEFVLRLGAKDNAEIAEGGQYYRFLTAMFLHGGLLHILFNGYALYVIGPDAERIYGTARFLAVYFIAGFAGGLASYALSTFNSVGASGAIFGMIGALFSFYYISRKVLGQVARQQLGSLITVIMLNLFIGFSAPNIDNFAHIGGLLGGALVGWLLAPRFALDERLYPPVVVRQYWPLGWLGAVGVLLILGLAVMVINPPM